jgi:ABC-type phosphate transport system substrate-binding protein
LARLLQKLTLPGFNLLSLYMMLLRKRFPVLSLTLTLALAAAPKASSMLFAEPVLAQSPTPTTFPLPSSVPSGTAIRVDGSSSMEVINRALKQRFEAQYSGATVSLAAQGTDAALKEVLDGSVDIAAIGRRLTNEESAQGLVETPISREKIAIIIGPDNRFKGDLTFEQFARMFRGEIKDWSEVGGAPGPIRFIDRPDFSDTRQALSNYSVFRAAPFVNGATTTRAVDDNTATILSQLGKDGISYAVASQVLDQPNVRVLSMHQTLPDDPRYPYSQPRNYVYKQSASPAVQAFLGYVTSPVGQQVIAAAKPEAAAVSPVPAASPTAPSPEASPSVAASASPEATPTPEPSAATNNTAKAGWWPWLLLPLAGVLGLLAWGMKGRRSSPAAEPSAGTLPDSPPEPRLAERTGSVITADRSALPERTVPAVSSPSVNPILAGGAVAAAGAAVAGLGKERRSRIVLTPRTVEQGYAYWEVPEAEKTALRQQGGEHLTLRIADVTGLEPDQPPLNIQEYRCGEADQDRFVALPQTERDYRAEIGYLTSDRRWLLLARSEPIRVAAPTASLPSEPKAAAATSVAQTIASTAVVAGLGATAVGLGRSRQNRIVLTPNEAGQAYAYWEAPETEKAILRQQGGEQLTLRLFDVTGLEHPVESEGTSLPAIAQYRCAETDRDRVVPIPQFDRDYLAEIGYFTPEQRWLLLARSEPVRLTAGKAVLSESAELAPETEPLISPITAATAGATLLSPLSNDALPDELTVEEQTEVEAAKFNVGQTDLSSEALASVDENLPDLPSGYSQSWITLLPRDPQWAYAYWDTPNEQKQALRQQGGQRLALRFYDVTNVDLKHQNPHSLQQYECDEVARDWYIPVPISDRDYIVEIGYVTGDGRWLMLARSNAVRIPPVYPADWYEEQFITVDWEDELRGQTFLELVPPEQKTSFDNPIYDRIFGLAESAEAQRVAGSLYGSMQQVPQASVSSFALGSGAGMAERTESGVGMSGAGLSGGLYSQSGVGLYTQSGAGFYSESGVGLYSQSGVGRYTESGLGLYSQSGAGLYSQSGVGLYTQSGAGLYSQSGVGLYTESGMGFYSQSGVGLYSQSGVGFYSQSGVGLYSQSGVGLYSQSGAGLLGGFYSQSGVGLYSESGVGLYSQSGVGFYSQSGIGLYSLSGVGMSGIGFFASMPPIRARKFWLLADAELIIYGATEPDATVTIAGRPVRLNPDGTFRFQMSFQDGLIDFPILAVAADGEQTRSIHLTFNRETPSRFTNTKDEAQDQPY